MARFALQVLLTLVIFFGVLFIYTLLAGPIPFSVNSITTTKSDSFSVTGEGKVSVTPDFATVRVGVQTTASTVKLAQDQLNTSVNSVSEAIKKLGIDSKDIQTENYNINPNIDYTTPTQRVTGYNANTNLIIKVKDLEKVNSVVDTATASGANQVNGITFDVEDKTKAENEARQKAVTEAKRKAEDAAKIAGFRLGKVINYSESFNGVLPMPFATKNEDLRAGGSAQTALEPGSKEVTINVTLSYEVL